MIKKVADDLIAEEFDSDEDATPVAAVSVAPSRNSSGAARFSARNRPSAAHSAVCKKTYIF